MKVKIYCGCGKEVWTCMDDDWKKKTTIEDIENDEWICSDCLIEQVLGRRVDGKELMFNKEVI